MCLLVLCTLYIIESGVWSLDSLDTEYSTLNKENIVAQCTQHKGKNPKTLFLSQPQPQHQEQWQWQSAMQWKRIPSQFFCSSSFDSALYSISQWISSLFFFFSLLFSWFIFPSSLFVLFTRFSLFCRYTLCHVVCVMYSVVVVLVLFCSVLHLRFYIRDSRFEARELRV